MQKELKYMTRTPLYQCVEENDLQLWLEAQLCIEIRICPNSVWISTKYYAYTQFSCQGVKKNVLYFFTLLCWIIRVIRVQ